ncbi:Metallo-dependent phosphatase-like protein [Cantharellus anzutake]|uniref:Metallo-dependent phosphatase-like protein n=1 Tax=Cantharellus anzutake TaxID=1750568 RepID=UPI00190587BA|nr:Metallo-dependent phosphatase-like protein [Cantharellus anzutake]KAF8325842.1 Metallo-dependent phosphatase-like protein [Cantharellus anzutake]
MSIRLSHRLIFKRSLPLTCYILFVLLLTFYIYEKPRPLGKFQHIGWQAFDTITPGVPAPSEPHDPSRPTNTSSVDWWDVVNDDSNVPPTSLPLDIWNPLLPHHTGLTEIAVKPCLLHPSLVPYCHPRTTLEDDALKGKWVRVERDLNSRTGRWYLHLWYRRSRRLDVPLITSLLILADDEIELIPEPKSAWHKVPGSLVDGVHPSQMDIYLWYKLRPPLQDASDDEEIQEAITELDILYGDGPPMFGFEKLSRQIFVGHGPRTSSVSVVFRRGVKRTPRGKPPHFNRDGTYKIMQIADLHYSVSEGVCRDTNMSPPCKKGDVTTDTLLSRALDIEKPDLVVFTGDQLNGQGTSWDSKSVLAKFAKTVIDKGINWAAVFGNHDDQTDLNRIEEMKILEALPFSLSKAGPREVDGVGNYVLKVRSPDPSKTHLLTLYFIDSGAYASRGWSFWKPPEYDWIKPVCSHRIDPIERPFTPDGGKDLGHIWNVALESRQNQSSKTLAKPNAMVFFHIPLPEAYYPADEDTKKPSRFNVGEELDGPGSPKHNSGFFEAGILRVTESEAGGREIKVIGNGHCHITDRCRRISGVWMCFGGGGSYSGYGRIGFDRRFRIYNVSDFGETIQTYKWTESGHVIDQQILTGRGAPPPFGRT